MFGIDKLIELVLSHNELEDYHGLSTDVAKKMTEHDYCYSDLKWLTSL